MINKTAMLVFQEDCRNEKLIPFATELHASIFFDQNRYFGQPLSKIFTKLIRFEIGAPYANKGVLYANRKIVELVRSENIDYVIWPTRTYEILEFTFQEIRKYGAKIIGWFFDDETRFDNYSQWWVPFMDYIFTADIGSVQRYLGMGIKAFHVPVSAEPSDFSTRLGNSFYDVSFVGSKYVADRDELVNRFIKDGTNISAFGNGWDNGFVTHEKMVEIFANSKINICFTKAALNVRKQLKGKIFDITMSGGFLLCEYVEGIENFFDLNTEIVCFKDYSDALEKIKYYLNNEVERKRIASAGQKK